MNRVDFEQKLLNCWNITTDIEDLRTQISNNCQDVPAEFIDFVDNYLLGMKSIYDTKFEQLFAMFEQGLDKTL